MPKRAIEGRCEFLHDHFHELHDGRNHGYEHDEGEEAQVHLGEARRPAKDSAPCFEHVVLEQVVHGHRYTEHEDHGRSQANGRLHRLAHGEVRAHAQEVGEDHVLDEDRLDEDVDEVHGAS
jgi:hypothetical protein